MNKSIFKSTLSATAISEIESITHYSEYRLNIMDRLANIFGYVLGAVIVATPFIFGVVANVNGI